METRYQKLLKLERDAEDSPTLLSRSRHWSVHQIRKRFIPRFQIDTRAYTITFHNLGEIQNFEQLFIDAMEEALDDIWNQEGSDKRIGLSIANENLPEGPILHLFSSREQLTMHKIMYSIGQVLQSYQQIRLDMLTTIEVTVIDPPRGGGVCKADTIKGRAAMSMAFVGQGGSPDYALLERTIRRIPDIGSLLCLPHAILCAKAYALRNGSNSNEAYQAYCRCFRVDSTQSTWVRDQIRLLTRNVFGFIREGPFSIPHDVAQGPFAIRCKCKM